MTSNPLRALFPLLGLTTAALLVPSAAARPQARPSAAEFAAEVTAEVTAEFAAEFAAEADELIASTLRGLDTVPGLSVAVVRGHEVVYLNAFGDSDVEQRVASQIDTLYYIASSTKSFTALAAALLEERGLIDLDLSLAEAFGDLRLDPVLGADRIALRDLLTHTSGIENQPIGFRLAYTGEHDPGLLRDLVAVSRPNRDAPTGTFEYTNIGYNIFTVYLDEQVGSVWQDLLQELIFEPAGMTRTTAYPSRAASAGWQTARPYAAAGPGELERLYLEKTDSSMQSAGGLLSTAQDMARWLEIQINGGALDGHQVFPRHVIERTHQSWATTSSSLGSFSREAYGLGWYIGEHAGQRTLHHFGGFSGYRAHVSFMPEARLGVAVLVNEAALGVRLADFIASFAYDWWLNETADRADYEARRDELVAQYQEGMRRTVADRAGRAGREWTLSMPLEAYTGVYENRALGQLRIEIEDGLLAARIGNLHSSSTPFTAPESIRVRMIPPGGQVVAFEFDADGEVVAARFVRERFVRPPERRQP